MTITPMIMAINDAAQEIPLENLWDGLGLLIFGLPIPKEIIYNLLLTQEASMQQ